MHVAGSSVSLAAEWPGDFWFLSVLLTDVSTITSMDEMKCLVERALILDISRPRVCLTSWGLLVSSCVKWG